MLLLPLRTPLLKTGDDLAKILMNAGEILPGDIIAVSSKAIATIEGAQIDMRTLKVSDDARSWSKQSGLPPEFCQAVIDECARLHGDIIRAVPHALMTKLHPEGMDGSLLVPNAGLDRSNVDDGLCIGWPRDPVKSAKTLSAMLKAPVIITDSCLRPGRRGVTAIALVTAGIAPIRDEKGTQDLFNKPLQITEEAVADQLATAANMLMGNAAQSTPAVIIRDHGIPFTDWSGWVPGMNENEDIFPAFA